jgi:lipopolysaccharide transport system permease protein
MNAQFRDVEYTLPFLTQFWFFSTPIAYSSSLVPEFWRPLYGLNPMVGVIEGFRWALLGTATAPSAMIAASAFTAVLLLITGAFYYRRLEKTFADVL